MMIKIVKCFEKVKCANVNSVTRIYKVISNGTTNIVALVRFP